MRRISIVAAAALVAALSLGALGDGWGLGGADRLEDRQPRSSGRRGTPLGLS